jgi:hypothetical protein
MPAFSWMSCRRSVLARWTLSALPWMTARGAYGSPPLPARFALFATMNPCEFGPFCHEFGERRGWGCRGSRSSGGAG